jgi:hypothetical protein
LPPAFFLSYSRKDLDQVATIGRILRLYGIRTWQDINGLGVGLSEDVIRAAIRNEISGLLFLSTEHSVSSAFIKSVELPEAEQRLKRDSTFGIVPVFLLSIEETDARLADCMTMRMSTFNGAKIAPSHDSEAVSQAAHRAAEIIWQQLKLAPTDDVLLVGLTSKQPPSHAVAIDFDFTPFFQNRYPTPTEWNAEFPRALSIAKQKLVTSGAKTIRLYSFAHLSIGILFGFVFRDRTGLALEIEQTNKGIAAQIWKTSEALADHAIQFREHPVSLGSRNLLVKINLVARDDASVVSYTSKAGLSYRAIMEAEAPHYPYLLTNGQAAAVARTLAEKIKELHGQYGTNTVHLFAAIPLGLALMIGYNLNACGFVQCYEYDNGEREYRPSCLLR